MIEVRRSNGAEGRLYVAELAAVLLDCVAGKCLGELHAAALEGRCGRVFHVRRT